MKNKKRVLAWVGIIVLGCLYLATLIFALIGSDWAYDMFKLCLGMSIILPILLYVYQMIYRTLGNGRDKQDNKTDEENL